MAWKNPFGGTGPLTQAQSDILNRSKLGQSVLGPSAPTGAGPGTYSSGLVPGTPGAPAALPARAAAMPVGAPGGAAGGGAGLAGVMAAPWTKTVATEASMRNYPLSLQTGTQRDVGGAIGQYLLGQLGGQTATGAGPSPVAGALQSLLAGELPAGVTSQLEALYQPVAAEATSQFERVTLPKVKEAYGGGGAYWSGARARAETRASEDFGTRLASMRAQMMGQLGPGAVQQSLAAMQLYPQLSQLQDPSYAARMAAVQQGLGLTGQRWRENVVQPMQDITTTYAPGGAGGGAGGRFQQGQSATAGWADGKPIAKFPTIWNI